MDNITITHNLDTSNTNTTNQFDLSKFLNDNMLWILLIGLALIFINNK